MGGGVGEGGAVGGRTCTCISSQGPEYETISAVLHQVEPHPEAVLKKKTAAVFLSFGHILQSSCQHDEKHTFCPSRGM